MLRVFVALLFLTLPAELLAQSKLPDDAVSQFIRAMAVKPGSVAVPLGTMPVPPQFIDQNGKLLPTNEFTRNMLTLERLGVIKITMASPNVTFELLAKPDGYKVRLCDSPNGPALCIASLDYSSAHFEPGKIQYVNGGEGQKSAAIVYGVIKGTKYFSLAKELNKANGEPEVPNEPQYRLLFREDVFLGKWKFVTFDLFDPDKQRFYSEQVPHALNQN